MKRQLCVLCGTRPASTGQGDHIPPKRLYTKAERKTARYQFHTIPACTSCNCAGSKYDEELKLLIGFESGEDRHSPQDVIDTMASTIRKNHRLAKQIFTTPRRIFLQRASGLQIPVVSIPFDVASYEMAVSRIARGMYWRMTGNILDSKKIIEVIQLRQLDQNVIHDIQLCVAVLPLTKVNGGTLKSTLIETEEADMMVLQLFNKHTVVAFIYSIETSEFGRMR
jgi:hypothetical protein